MIHSDYMLNYEIVFFNIYYESSMNYYKQFFCFTLNVNFTILIINVKIVVFNNLIKNSL